MSLVDLMLTMALLTVMLWSVVSMDGWLRGRFAREKTQSTLSVLRQAMVVYRGLHGVWPPAPSRQATKVLWADPQTRSMFQTLRWERDRHGGIEVLDGYGQPVGYVARGDDVEGAQADFVSVGPDGRLGDSFSDDSGMRVAAMDDLYGSDLEHH